MGLVIYKDDNRLLFLTTWLAWFVYTRTVLKYQSFFKPLMYLTNIYILHIYLILNLFIILKIMSSCISGWQHIWKDSHMKSTPIYCQISVICPDCFPPSYLSRNLLSFGLPKFWRNPASYSASKDSISAEHI